MSWKVIPSGLTSTTTKHRQVIVSSYPEYPKGLSISDPTVPCPDPWIICIGLGIISVWCSRAGAVSLEWNPAHSSRHQAHPLSPQLCLSSASGLPLSLSSSRAGRSRSATARVLQCHPIPREWTLSRQLSESPHEYTCPGSVHRSRGERRKGEGMGPTPNLSCQVAPT